MKVIVNGKTVYERPKPTTREEWRDISVKIREDGEDVLITHPGDGDLEIEVEEKKLPPQD